MEKIELTEEEIEQLGAEADDPTYVRDYTNAKGVLLPPLDWDANTDGDEDLPGPIYYPADYLKHKTIEPEELDKELLEILESLP